MMKWTNEKIGKLQRLCDEGISNKGIAEILGCTVGDVYARRSQLGITIDKCKKGIEPNPEFEAALPMPKKQEQVTKVLAQVKYRDLADLLFILSDQARSYHDLDDECDGLTLDQFTEWLCTMGGSVQLLVHQS